MVAAILFFSADAAYMLTLALAQLVEGKSSKADNDTVWFIVTAAIALAVASVLLWFLHKRTWILSGIEKSICWAVATIMGSVVLLGLPGGIIMQLVFDVADIGQRQMKPDASWPAAILVSLAWPLCFPLATAIVTERPHRLFRWMGKALVAILWSFLISAWVCWMG